MVKTQQQAADNSSVEPFISHLYPARETGLDPPRTYCGITVDDDPHALMHRGYQQKSPRFYNEGPGEQCPACGAPVCRTCATRFLNS